MESSADLLASVFELARQLSTATTTPPSVLSPEILAILTKTSPAHLEHALTTLIEQSRARLDRDPREASAFARVADELARAGATSRTQAETALALAGALNRLGEFNAALSACRQAAEGFARCDDAEGAARAQCEAAWAYTFIGDLDQALAAIEHARAATSSSLLRARCDWIHARVLRDQSHYAKAITLFENARDTLQAAQLSLDARRCEREVAHTRILAERGAVQSTLERLRRDFQDAGCALDAALCDYFLADALAEASRYAEALEYLIPARQTFAHLKADFFAAWCDLWVGVIYRHLNRFDEALRALQQARDYFLAQSIGIEVSACDINLGNTYYVLNRYDEALTHYQQAATYADQRATRLARIYTNMGLVYARQGAYAQALDLHHRALNIATSKDLTVLAAHNHANLAMCYRHLGQSSEALKHLEHARTTFTQQNMREQVAAREIDLAEIYLARGETAEASACLNRARRIAAADGLDSLVAICNHLLAQVAAQDADKARALALLENARTLFNQHAQIVDAALCDLTEGELRLQWAEPALARDCFERARRVLQAGLPDYRWRADYGLGRCAQMMNDGTTALDYYLQAVRTIAAARSQLATEQISNAFFAHRQSVFDDALALASQQGSANTALEVIEASKARTFLARLHAWRRDWRPRRAQDDPYIAQLSVREKELRYQLDALRERVAIQITPAISTPVRGEPETIATAALQELATLSQTYESVVTQLQLAATGLAGVSVPAPFHLEKFRQTANATFGTDWTALDYYLTEDTLLIGIITPTEVRVERRDLSAYDRAILKQCTALEADLRELIYRGTLRGEPVPSSGTRHLQRLYSLLIPAGLGKTLLIAPHGSLHRLPFAALVCPRNGTYLVEQHAIVYSPSLQALHILLNESSQNTAQQPLILGVSDFAQMRSLPSAAVEVERVHKVFDGRGITLWGDQATRQKILALNASDELHKFDVLHFATHAVLDRAAPHHSYIQLSDGALTILDILDLGLNARLVTLSACQTALGASGAGDEWVSLARAFFYAGARALLVTLWSVEDEPQVGLVESFYRYLTQGKSAAMALRKAQIEMIRAGRPPYQWAAFALIGRP